jgi:hypothetical protein
MDYPHFMGGVLLGSGPAVAIFFLLGASRRARVPLLAWWLSLGLGIPLVFYGLSHSTSPSFSTPVTAVGKAYDHEYHEDHSRHGTSYDEFRFVPEGGKPINIETFIGLPNWGIDGSTVRIVYLNGSFRFLSNEAIDISILSGEHKGFHDSLDARPFGRWLAVPIGVALIVLSWIALKQRKDDVGGRDDANSDDHTQVAP